MLERLSQSQFEQILNMVIIYKQVHPNKDVYLNERCVKEAINYMQIAGKELQNRGVNLNQSMD
uniref:Uncharacterized protein n=1 Tax=viral metagenome TaxID=1070528 RepID=A0A6C0IVP8_9ZZZZ